jgi:acetylornithine deacetylase
MTFSDAPDEEHRARSTACMSASIHGALGRDLHEWRPPQVADFVRLKGSGRYGPGQSEANALADIERVLADALSRAGPG